MADPVAACCLTELLNTCPEKTKGGPQSEVALAIKDPAPFSDGNLFGSLIAAPHAGGRGYLWPGDECRLGSGSVTSEKPLYNPKFPCKLLITGSGRFSRDAGQLSKVPWLRNGRYPRPMLGGDTLRRLGADHFKVCGSCVLLCECCF